MGRAQPPASRPACPRQFARFRPHQNQPFSQRGGLNLFQCFVYKNANLAISSWNVSRSKLLLFIKNIAFSQIEKLRGVYFMAFLRRGASIRIIW